jgi:cation:H+ antiporter
LILGIAALVCPMKAHAEVVQREMPVMIGVTVLLWILLADGQLGRIDGLILFAGSFAYTFFVYFVARRNKSREVEDEFAEAVDSTSRPCMAGCADADRWTGVAVVGAKMLIDGALCHRRLLQGQRGYHRFDGCGHRTSLPEFAHRLLPL